MHGTFSWIERLNLKTVTVPFPESVQALASSLLESVRNSSTDEAELHGFMRLKQMTGQKWSFGTSMA